MNETILVWGQGNTVLRHRLFGQFSVPLPGSEGEEASFFVNCGPNFSSTLVISEMATRSKIANLEDAEGKQVFFEPAWRERERWLEQARSICIEKIEKIGVDKFRSSVEAQLRNLPVDIVAEWMVL